jgi:hypothetical protein
MNNINNLKLNLSLNINDRKSTVQRENDVAYKNKFALLQSIHNEIDEKNSKDDSFDTSDVDGNQNRYIEHYNLGTF